MSQASDSDDDLCIAAVLAAAAAPSDSDSQSSDDVPLIGLVGTDSQKAGDEAGGDGTEQPPTEGDGAAAAKPGAKKPRAKKGDGTAPAKPKKARAEGAAAAASTATKPAAAAKAKKPAKLTQAEATEMVAAWFRTENKPTMPAALIAALGSRVSKTQTQVALDALVASGAVVTRDIKKAVIYFANQQSFSALSPEETMRLKDEIAASKARLIEMETAHRDTCARANAITVVSNDELRAQVAALEVATAALKERIGGDDGAPMETVDREVMAKAARDFQILQREWRGMQRVGTGIIDSLALDRRADEVAAELGLTPEDPALVAAVASARIPQAFKAT